MNDLIWMSVAKSYLGTREGPGAANNPAVVELFKLAGHPEVKDDATAWCAAFVGGVLAKAGLPGSKMLNARSYETWGQALPLNAPVYGCVGVKKRQGGEAWQGHVGFVVGSSASHIILLGGNQGDSVSFAEFPRSEFTAFRYPNKITLPKTAHPLPTSIAGVLRSTSEA